ncbi:conserved hypothetical protein [Desulfofarcimen acetoxidans DSM 771]|uniref:Uncharacterized protein n=1 Tax=Desulfofarcimen acetoxidans (strain ATCC 49208 / DSM 771 / KCTC 5769 / VKM B-1644 / 5575) TaxID=485916 RepID=C8VWP1_DESAS|nr:hypothetical protein [Desulfofarcimen acetoxidans]ACV64405.1 conserved hypothetical protein [Desulfofarcimen acetoxidans DSM 771]
MINKYLLYIDILGFSNLVKNDYTKIDKIYKLINSLNVHKHYAFNTIVFSDTILVYNSKEPRSEEEHKYLVMYAVEFAQDLWFRTVGKEIFFRGILRYGPFNHNKLSHIDAFYGDALIESYLKEKDLNCCGLFIDNSCIKYNDIFPTLKYDKNLNYVFYLQSLERLMLNTDGNLSTDPFFLNSTYDYWSILWDLRYLRDINNLMTNHPEPKVRSKYLITWHIYRARYRKILDLLEQADFNPLVICNEYDWSEMEESFSEQIESWYE